MRMKVIFLILVLLMFAGCQEYSEDDREYTNPIIDVDPNDPADSSFNFRYSVQGNDQVILEWNDLSSEVNTIEGYNLYYGTVSGEYDVKIDMSKSNRLDIKCLANDTTYYGILKAYDLEGKESAESEELEFITPSAYDTTPPLSVGGVKAVEITTDSITIRWTKSSECDSGGYRLSFGISEGSYDDKIGDYEAVVQEWGESVANGTNNKDYVSIKSHISTEETRPITGRKFLKYWKSTGTTGKGVDWKEGEYYHPANEFKVSQLTDVSETLFVLGIEAYDTSKNVSPIVTFTADTAPEGMVYVPIGDFFMGDNDGEEEDQKPLHIVTLNPFFIDQYEVSIEDYTAFLNDPLDPELISLRGRWDINMVDSFYSGIERHGSEGEFTYSVYPGRKKYAVTYVNHTNAADYCASKGKRLPTEAEWEKAARGTELIDYPWGDAAPDDNKASYDRYYPEKIGTHESGVSPYNAHDMAGGVWEWVSDWYNEAYYLETNLARNPKGPEIGTKRVVRGGSWEYLAIHLKSAFRKEVISSQKSRDIGFRCAKNTRQIL